MLKQYYVIKKILNNNVVISENEDKKEIIIMGSGIGFGKHVHDLVDSKKIYKIYELRNNAYKNRFEKLVEEIPFECFQLTESIIEYAQNELHQNFKDGLVLTLADHIHFAVTQIQNHQTRVTLSLDEIKLFYQDEYKVAKHAVKMIEEFYNIHLEPTEAASIAFHFIMGNKEQNEADINVILKGTRDILDIIEESLGIELNETNPNFYRLVIHLKYFIKRVIIEKQECKDAFGAALFNEKDERFKIIKNCLDNIEKYLKKTYGYDMDSSERLYLFIHITRIL